MSTRNLVKLVSSVLLAIAGCAAEERLPLVESRSEAVTFVPSIDDPAKLMPQNVDLCWVDDTNRGTEVTDEAYQAKKDQIRATMQRWADRTNLRLRWQEVCPGPIVNNDNLFTYAAQEVRIYLDASPLEPPTTRIPGLMCPETETFPALGDSRASFPDDRRDLCAINMVLRFDHGAGTMLHELGHALGLMHEQIRRDAPEACWTYEPHLASWKIPGVTSPRSPTITDVANVATALDPEEHPDYVQFLRFELNLTHAVPQLVQVTLTAPNGVSAILHAWGDATAPLPVYTSDDPASPLAPLLGAPVVGNWTVTVSDPSPWPLGQLHSWALFIDRRPRHVSDGIYATGYTPESVMHYLLPGCAATGLGRLGLSDVDHLAAEMAYSTGVAPVLGAGVYRSDQPVRLRSAWADRGALVAVASEPQLNYAFITDVTLSVRRGTATIATARQPSLTTGSLAPGDYTAVHSTEDYWGRVSTDSRPIRVIDKAQHAALVVSIVR